MKKYIYIAFLSINVYIFNSDSEKTPKSNNSTSNLDTDVATNDSIVSASTPTRTSTQLRSSSPRTSAAGSGAAATPIRTLLDTPDQLRSPSPRTPIADKFDSPAAATPSRNLFGTRDQSRPPSFKTPAAGGGAAATPNQSPSPSPTTSAAVSPKKSKKQESPFQIWNNLGKTITDDFRDLYEQLNKNIVDMQTCLSSRLSQEECAVKKEFFKEKSRQVKKDTGIHDQIKEPYLKVSAELIKNINQSSSLTPLSPNSYSPSPTDYNSQASTPNFALSVSRKQKSVASEAQTPISFDELQQKISTLNLNNEELTNFLQELREWEQEKIDLNNCNLRNYNNATKAEKNKLKTSLNKLDILQENLKNELYKAISQIFNEKISLIGKQQKKLDDITHQEVCSKLSFNDFLTDSGLINYYEFFSDKTIDNNLYNIINNKSKLTNYGIRYINLAHGLYHELETQNIFKSLPEKFTCNNQDYPIKSWKLIHVFLGTLDQKDFTGLHFCGGFSGVQVAGGGASATASPKNATAANQFIDLLYDNLIPVHDDNNNLNAFVFYKKCKLYTEPVDEKGFFIKRCTFFPLTMSISECVESCKAALSSIQNFKYFHNVLEITGLDNSRQLIIRIYYDIQEQSIETFFPTFKGFEIYEKSISENVYHKFLLERNKIPKNQRTFEKLKDTIDRLIVQEQEEQEEQEVQALMNLYDNLFATA